VQARSGSGTARALVPSLRSWLASGMTPPQAPHLHHHTAWTWPARTGGPWREAPRCAASSGRAARSEALLGPSALTLTFYSPFIIFTFPRLTRFTRNFFSSPPRIPA